MRNGVKCSTEVEEDEDGERSGVSCTDEVVGDPNQGCFIAVFLAETGLKGS